MKVLLTGAGSRGDIQPLVALAIGLRAAGHEARVCGTSNGRAMASAHGIAFIDAGGDTEALLKEEPGLVQGKALGAARRVRAWLLEALDHQYAVLREEMPWADVAIGAGLVNAPSSVAEALQIPYRFAIYCAQAVPSTLHGPYSLRTQGLPGWMNAAAWRANDAVLKQVVGAAMNRNRAALGLAPIGRISDVLTPRGQLLFAADPELSPPPLDYDANLPITGPWLLPVEGSLAPALQAFIDAGDRPVYLGFGSMPDDDAATTTRLVLAAAERSRVRVVLSAGWAGLGAGTLPDTCFALGEAPHALLFEQVAGVVHHGGAGTVATAARAGAPQLILPHVMDQHYWADRVHRLGLGPKPLARRALSVDGLSQRLIDLRATPAYRARAEALRGPLSARDGVALAVSELEHIADRRR